METRTGRRVDLAVRDTSKGEKAARLTAADSASVVELDLSDLDQLAGFARRIQT